MAYYAVCRCCDRRFYQHAVRRDVDGRSWLAALRDRFLSCKIFSVASEWLRIDFSAPGASRSHRAPAPATRVLDT